MPPDPGAWIDPSHEQPEVDAAFRSSAVGDIETAVQLWSKLSDENPDEGFFPFQKLNALLEVDRTSEAVRTFEEVQKRDPVEDRCRSLHHLLGKDAAPYSKDFTLVEYGAGRTDRHADYWSFVKLATGFRYLSLPIAPGEGILVEGLIGKRVGDDDCCRIEVDNGREREVVVFNARTISLRSSSQALRISLDRHLRPFRLVVMNGASRLWIDGSRVVQSNSLVPSRTPGLRLGLVESIDNLDTDFMWGSVRIAVGLKGKSPDEFAPYRAFNTWMTSLALMAFRAGRTEDTLAAMSAALGGTPPPSVVEACAQTAVAIAEGSMDASVTGRPVSLEGLLSQVASRLRELGCVEAAERIGARTQKRGEIAVVCDRVSVLFARAPHKITQPVEVVRRLLRPKEYRAENYRRVVEDVSLELRYGNVLGIIGNNGAGKSTLLRAIAGIVDYEGRIHVNGLSRLLVMGVGIQEELTGKENIRLGCLYLGMRRKEITRRLPEILEFAELTDAQDLPYRYYSDGMKARLLFSIATSVEPDILLLDELLGAGDVRFRAKATARMEQLIEGSKAMIIVTHNLSFVRERATQVIYMDRGRVRFVGDPHRAVDLYFEDNQLAPSSEVTDGRQSLNEEI